MQLAVVSNKVTCLNWLEGAYVGEYTPRPRPEACMPMRSLSWSHTGGWLCLCNDWGEIEIISFANGAGTLLRRYEQFADIGCATFQNLNKRNLAFAKDDHILLFDIKTQSSRRQFPPLAAGHRYTRLQFDARDHYLCAAATNDTVYVYNATGLCSKCETAGFGRLTGYTLHNHVGGALRLATATNAGAVVVWELDGSKHLFNEQPMVAIRDIAFDAHNGLMYITDDRRMVYRNGSNTTTITQVQLPFAAKCLDVRPDGFEVAVCAEDDAIYALDVRKLGNVMYQLPQRDFGGSVTALAFSKKTEQRTSMTYAVAMPVLADDDDLSVPVQPVPVMHVQNIAAGAVPIVAAASNDESAGDTHANPTVRTTVRLSDIRDTVCEVVREQMTAITDELKDYVHKTVVQCTTRGFLDLQMALLKEFIKIEQLLLKASVCVDNSGKDAKSVVSRDKDWK